LVERLVDTGATVRKGDVLARLDSADQRNRVLSAEAQVRAAQASVDQAVPLEARYRQLLSTGVTTPRKYEEAKKQLQRSNDELADAQAQLAKSRSSRVASSRPRALRRSILSCFSRSNWHKALSTSSLNKSWP
jgi:multidrug efflux pump subunit AcrA (membrane-fusion protein)